jgi:cellulose synthase/poly-beta-1,6-N-acetylglucosamine synthase-like glycosyltransferase
MMVTVGICAYNEERTIGNLLKSILNYQRFPAKSEVLVVCSGCTDNTINITQKWAKKDGRVKLLIENERRGKASAVNKILSNANGELILFISADTLPNDNCFSFLISRFQESDVGLVSARPEPVNSSTSLLCRVDRILWNLHHLLSLELSKNREVRHASEAFCLRRDIIKKIPEEIVNDDAYVALLTRRKKWITEYEPKARVSIWSPQTLGDYCRQRKRVVFGHYQIRKMTGENPQYFVSFATLFHKQVIRTLIRVAKSWGVLKFTLFSSLEVLANIGAIYDMILGKSHKVWRVVDSTKKQLEPDTNTQCTTDDLH